MVSIEVISMTENTCLEVLLAPHTSGPRDLPRCGALSLLQKDAALQGGIKQKPLYAERKFVGLA